MVNLPKAVTLPKFALDEVVNLYDVLPMLSLNVEDSIKVISDINYSQITIKELINYITKQKKEQNYMDYNGVYITKELVSNLKAIIKKN